MKIAVTGGTGCLGRPLVEKLITDGAYLKLLTLPNDSAGNFPGNQIETIIGDLNSSEALDRLCMNCNIVFHLAGRVHMIPRTKVAKERFIRVNVEGTRNLLEAAKKNKIKRVVFYSSVAVYGKDTHFQGDELSPCQPNSIYAESKYLAEKLVLNSLDNGGPEGVVLRFPVVYGPLDRGNVAKLIKSVHGKYFFYFGDGFSVRSMISSKNAAEAAIKGAFEHRAANELFCVTDIRNYKLSELIEAICIAINTNWRPIHLPISTAIIAGKLGDLIENLLKISCPINTANVKKLTGSLTFSCDKARRILKYNPVETLEEGIRREVEWMYPQVK